MSNLNTALDFSNCVIHKRSQCKYLFSEIYSINLKIVETRSLKTLSERICINSEARRYVLRQE